MPLFVDIHHKVERITTEAITAAHQQDLTAQAHFADEIVEIQEGA